MSKITLKINSFAQQNTVLVDGNPVQINSEFMNYYSRPIIKCAERILNAAESEFNDTFDVEVYGNLFEQRLLQFVCDEYELCQSCTVHNTDIVIPTADRLRLLCLDSCDDVEIPVDIVSDSFKLSFPRLPGIALVPTPDTKILVSDSMDYIEANISSKVLVAFVVNGSSRRIKNTYVIGCAWEEIEELVCSFIDTCFLNPFINEKAGSLVLSGDQLLANRVDPYFYIEDQLSINCGDSLELPLKSIPEEASKAGVFCLVKGNTVSINGLSVVATAPGICPVDFYYDSPISFTSTSIRVVKHSTVKDIDIIIDNDGNVLSSGKSYPITIDFSPKDAEDASDIVVTVSGTAEAEIENNYLVVKSAGDLCVTAKTESVCQTVTLAVLPVIQSIHLSQNTCNMYFGDVVEIAVAVTPSNAFNPNYKWITSDKGVAVVGVDHQGRELIKATGVGSATIRCVSTDNENIFAELPVVVSSTLSKTEKPALAFWGLIFAILAFLFGLLELSVLFWTAIGVSVVSLLVQVIKNKNIIDIIAPVIILVVSIILFL